MNKFPRYVSRQLTRCFPERWIMNRPLPCFLPFYHVVSDEKLPYILNYPYRKVAQFEDELDYFLKYFHPVGLEEIVSGSCWGKPVFHLSFDDGLRQCADIIAPVLRRKGLPATFFINTAFAGNKRLFHRYKASLIVSRLREKPDRATEKFLASRHLSGERILSASSAREEELDEAATMLGISFDKFLAREQPYLTVGQIKQLASDGFSIGAHGHRHPEFWNLTEEEQFQEVKTSMKWVAEWVNPPIRAFSFPFTDSGVPAQVLTRLRNEGICDVTFGTAGIKNDAFSFHFQRYPAEQTGNAVHQLKAEILYYEFRKWVGKATVNH